MFVYSGLRPGPRVMEFNQEMGHKNLTQSRDHNIGILSSLVLY